MRWYHLTGPDGTITIKSAYESKARDEAAERWGCDVDEVEIVASEGYCAAQN